MDTALLEDKEQLRKLYINEGMSCETIRKNLKVGHKRVEEALKRFGIPYRGLSEAATIFNIKSGKWTGDKNPNRIPEFKKKLFGPRPSMRGENNPWYGKHLSEEVREKMRLSKIKPHTPLYKQIRNCVKADQWSRDILKRDDYTCQDRKRRGGYLEAHHLVGFKELFKEFKIETFEQAMTTKELWSLDNGITLCKPCHRKTDNFGGRG